MKLTIIAPAFNEEDVIEQFIEATLPALQPDWELLVVDDGSTDATPSLLRSATDRHPRLRVVTHPENRGLGAALATGFAAARGDLVATIDADLSHPLDLLPELVAACETGDAAFASRYIRGGGMVGVPLLRAAISRLANLILRVAFLSPIHDLTTGYRVYRREVVGGLDLTGSGFETQLEITVRLIAAGRRIAEVPLVLTNRAAGSSKMRYLALIGRYGRMALRLLRVRYWESRR